MTAQQHRTDHAASTGRGSSSRPAPCADVDAAWATLTAEFTTEAEAADACRTIIAHCTDARRDTARDILAAMG